METFTEADIVSFGNYLLSEKRRKRVKVKNRGEVHHEDLENWKTEKESK